MNPQLDPDYYRRIDFPVSRVWADHYEAQGAIVHKSRVREEPPISADVSPETAQLLARVMERQEEILNTVNGMITDQAQEIDKIKGYLREKHEERKQEIQSETVIPKTATSRAPERARTPHGFNLPADGMARLINGCAYWKDLEKKQKTRPGDVTFDELNDYIVTFSRFGKAGEERITQFARLAPDYDPEGTIALIETARNRQSKAPSCKELGCRLDPARCGVGNG